MTLEERITELEAKVTDLTRIAKYVGVCMSCIYGAPDPIGCTDCLGTGWDRGEDPIAHIAELEAELAKVERWKPALDNALWLLMKFPIHRYLISNAHGRLDGAEKAIRHAELCKIFVAVEYGCIDLDKVRMEHNADFEAVHDATKKLTDNMDEVIGFPIESVPDYDALAPKFFNYFIQYAREATSAHARSILASIVEKSAQG